MVPLAGVEPALPKELDFDSNLSAFAVARLYHQPSNPRCWALFHLVITSKLLPVIKPMRLAQVVVEPFYSVDLDADWHILETRT